MECKEIEFSRHAIVQMFARSITKDQVVHVIKDGVVVIEYDDDKPFPSKLLLGYSFGTPIHVVIGYDEKNTKCIVVTAYKPDDTLWESDYKTRRST